MKLIYLKILILKNEGEPIECCAGIRGVEGWDGCWGERGDSGVKYRCCMWIRATRDPESERRCIIVEHEVR